MLPPRTAAAPGFYRASGLVHWPLPGFPGGCRKLTLAGMAIALKVSFLALPRTHTGGQQLPLTVSTKPPLERPLRFGAVVRPRGPHA
jgi:hypothetical protein